MSLRGRLAGLAAAAALGGAVFAAYRFYDPRIDLWTGVEALAPLRPWLAEFRVPLIGVGAILLLSGGSWVLRRLRLER